MARKVLRDQMCRSHQFLMTRTTAPRAAMPPAVAHSKVNAALSTPSGYTPAEP
jgi:hypothetical protein